VTNETWAAPLRAHFPVLERCTYLNTGTAGPIPVESAEAIREEAAYELAEGRANFATFGRYLELRERTRALLARLLGAESREIALAHHTSEAVNIVLWGIAWRPGDRVVTTTLEHDALAVPLGLLRERHGIELRFADIGHGERALEGIAAALTRGARLVALSHVVYSTGALLPLAEITEMAHRAGAAILVDGAQTAGVLPLDLRALGVDFYTVSGQKWLCGPEGTGALFVRLDRLPEVRPTFASYFSARSHDYRGQVELHPDARRFETGMFYRPGVAGLEASLRLALDEVRVERAWERSLELAGLCRRRMAALDGVEIVTPETQGSPLVSFDLPAFSPAHLHALALAFAAQGLVIRSIDHPPYALRASLGYFNTAAEVEVLVEAVREAVQRGPEGVPLERASPGLPAHR
jgi:L-cysteine/cystine lyase